MLLYFLCFAKFTAAAFVDHFSTCFNGILTNNDKHIICFKGFYCQKIIRVNIYSVDPCSS